MIAYTEIRKAYNDLYREMRRYYWDPITVEALVDLEVASYQTCLDMPKVSSCLNALNKCIFEIAREDEDLQKAYDKFKELVDKNEDPYVKIYRVSEVI